jgi:hypothetical protein
MSDYQSRSDFNVSSIFENYYGKNNCRSEKKMREITWGLFFKKMGEMALEKRA